MPKKAVPNGNHSTAWKARALAGIALLSATPAWTQDILVKVRYFQPMNPKELINDIDSLNATPDQFGVFNLTGKYIFDELPDGQAGEDVASPLPILKNIKAAFSFNNALIEFRFAKPTGNQKALFRTENAQIFVHALLAIGGDSDTAPNHVSSADTVTQAFPDDLESGLKVEGVDYFVHGDNSVVISSGVAAKCEEDCVNVDGSHVIVTNSYFECDDSCVWLEDAGGFEGVPDLEGIREALEESELPADDVAAMARELKQAEALLKEYDAAVIDSEMHAGEIAVFNGGSTALESRLLVDGSRLQSRDSEGRALSLKDESTGHLVHNSVLSAPVTRNEALDFVYGAMTVRNSFLEGGEQALEVTEATARLDHTSIALDSVNRDTACEKSFPNFDQIVSFGHNVAPDETCFLDGPGDMPSTESGLFLEGDSLVPQFMAGALEIDGGSAMVAEGELPCSPTDMLGLARPQDGDGDGTAQCDIGPVELQVGPDLTAAQSGAFFDAGRDGEGIFLELLGDSLALVYLFSYRPDGSPFWAVGVGKVRGNGVVIPARDFQTTSGPSFGETFNPDDVLRVPFAELSLSFPDCTNNPNRGVLSIAPNRDLGFGPLLSRTKRLTLVMDCGDLSTKGPGYTGSFFDPSHDGEGIIVHVVSATQAVAIWFTYDGDGNQYWVLGVGALSGNTLTVTDAFSQRGPSYGPDYDANAIVRTTWGDFSLVFDAQCNSAALSYASVLAEFGSGNQAMVRLSRVDGLAC